MPNALAIGAMPLSNQGAPPSPSPALPPSRPVPPAQAPTPAATMPAPTPPDPAKLQDAIHKTVVMDNKLKDLLAKAAAGGSISRGDVIDAVTGFMTDHIMSPQSAATYLADLPEDPQDIREWVQRHADEGQVLLVQMVFAQHGSMAESPPDEAQPGAPPPEMMSPGAPLGVG